MICPSQDKKPDIQRRTTFMGEMSHGVRYVTYVLYLTLGVVLVMGHTVYGEETTTQEFPERLKLFGGYQMLFGVDAKFRLDGSQTGLGSTVDFHDDIGGDQDDNMIRAGGVFRFNQHHAIAFSWYDMNLRGNRTIDDSLQIDDTIFLANGNVTGKIDLTLYRFFYNWSFYRSDQAELIFSPGMYFGDFEAKFSGAATIDPGITNPITKKGSVQEKLFAPLPTIGLSVEYKILPRLTANIRTDFFYVNINDIEGSMAELFVGLEYRLFKHFSVGVAYDRLIINLDYKSGKSNGWELDAAWNGALFYGALYF